MSLADIALHMLDGKKCSKCKDWKNRECFYTRKEAPKGLDYSCKTCKGSYQRRYGRDNKKAISITASAYREKNKAALRHKRTVYYKANRESLSAKSKQRYRDDPEPQKERSRIYNQTAEGKAAQYRSSKKHRSTYPERHKARTAVGHALRDGRLSKSVYCWCGCFGIATSGNEMQAHHADYGKPLDVAWMLRLCHMRMHRLGY